MKPTPSQLTCIRDTFGIPCAVAAGAGSGKTATLTNRIVYALAHSKISGVTDIDQVLAITYTKKAANELKSRIRSALQEASHNCPALAEQALKADGAWISTIHGMCARILKENALTLGLDPSFGMLSDDLGQQLRSQAIAETIAAHNSETSISGLFEEYSSDQIAEMLEELMTLTSTDTDPVHLFFTASFSQGMQAAFFRLVSLAREIYRLTRGETGPKTIDRWNEDILAILETTLGVSGGDAVLAPLSADDEARLLALNDARIIDLAARFPKIPGQPKLFKQPPLRDAKVAYVDAVANLRLASAYPHLKTLISLVAEANGLFAAFKTQLGVLDNDDLLARCAAALQDPRFPEIRARYRDRFKIVMVDEFQDTDQAQVDMINLVAGNEGNDPSPRMCVVGDAQQSIYRFRHADLAVFKDYVARVRRAQEHGSGIIVHLEENFRSHGEILAFCKGAFEKTFGKEDYLELLHGRNENIASARTPFFGAEGIDDPDPDQPRRINVIAVQSGRKKTVARTATAQAIARDLKALADAGNEPGQMAVLLGSMSKAAAYAEALHAEGLPCAIAGGSVFNKAPEVNLIVDLAYSLTNPLDTTRSISILASPLFGLEAHDLLQASVSATHRPAPEGSTQRRPTLARVLTNLLHDATPADLDARIEHLAQDNHWSFRLSTALKVWGSAALQVGYRPLSSLINEVLANSGWLSRRTSEQRTQAGNMFKAIRILQDIEGTEQACGLTLARRLDERIEGLKEAPGVLAAAGDNFVRIMTIHASKGLQFPIVAVAETDPGRANSSRLHTLFQAGNTYVALDAGRSLSRYPKSLLADCLSDLEKYQVGIEGDQDDDFALDSAQIALSGNDGPSFLLAIDRLNKAGDAEEYQRKLYVAFTRAEDCLIIAQHRTSKGFRPGAPAMVEHLLTGDDGISFNDEQAHAHQLFRIDTSYPDHPAENLSWIARLETINLKAPDFEEYAADQEKDAADKGNGQAGSPSLTPTAHLTLDAPAFPFAPQWAEGILSASSLKHEQEGELLYEVPIAVVDLDEEFEEAPASAPEKGTAFHSLGEYAARAWQDTGRIVMPPAERIEAIARLHGLDTSQKARLEEQLQCWINSPVAQAMASCAHLVAEAPFFIPLAPAHDGTGSLTLNGFIDLLAYDMFGTGCAQVVDYKTGRHLKTDAARRAAYEIQAKCYAYALLLQGFDRVELDFVFVDQPDLDNPGIPSVTHFPPAGDAPYQMEELRRELEQAARTLRHG